MNNDDGLVTMTFTFIDFGDDGDDFDEEGDDFVLID